MCAAIFVDTGERQNSQVISTHDGRSYHLNQRRQMPNYTRLYLRCTNYRKRCPGTAIMEEYDDGTQVFTNMQRHHESLCHGDPLNREARVLRNTILEACRNNRYERPRVLFNRIAAGSNPHVIARVAPHRIRYAMRRARWGQFPNLPHEIVEVEALLTSPQYRHLSTTFQDPNDNVFSGLVGEIGARSLVFVSRRMLTFMEGIQTVFVDATFASRPGQPDGITQVYQIVTIVRDTVVPLVIALMERKSQSAYEAILRHLLQVAPNFHPRTVLADFEIAEQNAWAEVFHCEVSGCYVHFIRASKRHLAHLGLEAAVRGDEVMREVVDAMFAIPLLPKRLLNKGFVVIAEYARRKEVLQPLLPFFEYFAETWLNGPLSRTVSVFGQPFRTNNACESAHSNFRHYTGPYHPNFWLFLDAVRNYEFYAFVDVVAFREGHRMGPGRRRSVLWNDHLINTFTRDLLQGTISVKRFLLRASVISRNLIDE